MERGELDVALGLYDAQIRADKTDDYRDISNATSLLMRLGAGGHGHWAPLGRTGRLSLRTESKTAAWCLLTCTICWPLQALIAALRGTQ